MNLKGSYFVIKGAVLALGSALMITSCGNGSSSAGMSKGAVAQAASLISTSDQGAQAAFTGVSGAEAAAALGVKLSGMADTAAATIASLPKVYIPVTFDCTSRSPVLGNGTNTVTVVQDPFSGVVTATMNACLVGAESVTGVMTADSSGGGLTLTLGSGSAPLVVTGFAAAGSATVSSMTDALATVTYSPAGTTDTLGVTGSLESWDYGKHAHDRYDLNGVSIVVAKSAVVIGVDNYDAATVILSGTLTRTAYVSDVDATVSFTQAGSLTNLSVVQETPVAGSAAVYKYISLNGEYAVASTPPSVCIDGDFVFVTNADIQIDMTTGLPVAGQLTINSNTVAAYNADGSLSVAVNGAAPTTYPAATLATLCPI